jgi:hypothetical protein
MDILFITPAKEYAPFAEITRQVIPESFSLPLLQKRYSPRIPANLENSSPGNILQEELRTGLELPVREELAANLRKMRGNPLVIIITDPDNSNDLHAALIHNHLKKIGIKAFHFRPHALEKRYLQHEIPSIIAELDRSSIEDNFCQPILSRAETAILRSMIRIHAATVLKKVLTGPYAQSQNITFSTDALKKKASFLENLFAGTTEDGEDKLEIKPPKPNPGELDTKWLTSAYITTIQTIRGLTEEGQERYYEIGIEPIAGEKELTKEETWRLSLPPSTLLAKFSRKLQANGQYPDILAKLEDVWKKEDLRIRTRQEPLITTNFQLRDDGDLSLAIQRLSVKEEALALCKQINTTTSSKEPRFIVIGEENIPNINHSRKPLTLPEFIATTMTDKQLPTVGNSLNILYNLYNLGWITWPKVNGNTVPDYIASYFSSHHFGKKDFFSKTAKNYGTGKPGSGEWIISPTKPGVKKPLFIESLTAHWLEEQKRVLEQKKVPTSKSKKDSKTEAFPPIADTFEKFAEIHWTIYTYIHSRFYEFALPQGHAGEKYCWCVGPVNANNQIQSKDKAFFFVRQLPKFNANDPRTEPFPQGHKPTEEELQVKRPIKQPPEIQASVSPIVTYADALQTDDNCLSYLLVCYDILQPSSFPAIIGTLESKFLILLWKDLQACFLEVRREQMKLAQFVEDNKDTLSEKNKKEISAEMRRRNYWLESIEKIRKHGRREDPDPETRVCTPALEHVMVQAEQIIPILVLPKEIRKTQTQIQASLQGGMSADDVWYHWTAEVRKQLDSMPKNPLKGILPWGFDGTRGFSV